MKAGYIPESITSIEAAGFSTWNSLILVEYVVISRAEAVHQCAGIHPSGVSRSFVQLGHYFAQAYPRPLDVDKANPGLFGWRLPTAALRGSEMPVMLIEYRKAVITRQGQWGHRVNWVRSCNNAFV